MGASTELLTGEHGIAAIFAATLMVLIKVVDILVDKKKEKLEEEEIYREQATPRRRRSDRESLSQDEKDFRTDIMKQLEEYREQFISMQKENIELREENIQHQSEIGKLKIELRWFRSQLAKHNIPIEPLPDNILLD